MTTTIPLADAGMASFESQDFNVIDLFSGDTPVSSVPETLLDQNADTPAYTVVGRITASGKVTICNLGANDGSQVPCGITTAPAPDSGADQKVSTFKTGMFNPAALNWHASFDTDEKKRLAFEGSKAPGIFIRKVGA